MKEKHDVIVIGSDHNGLIAAVSLAKRGRKVLVMDPREFVGGPCGSVQLSNGLRTNGLLTDTSSFSTDVANSLGMTGSDVRWHDNRPDLILIAEDGQQKLLNGNHQKALLELKKWAPNDADGYDRYRTFIGQITPLIKSIFSTFPPDVLQPDGSDLWGLIKKMIRLKRLPKATLTEFLKVAPMSVKDFLDERFDDPALKSLLALQGIRGTPSAPMSAYTTLNLLIWECLSERSFEGRATALLKALLNLSVERGVEIRTGQAIDGIEVDGGKVRGVKLKNGALMKCNTVLSTFGPTVTFRTLCKPVDLPVKLDLDTGHFRCRGHEAKVFLGLSDLPDEVKKTDWSNSVFVSAGPMIEIERTFDPWKYGSFAEKPVIEIRFTKHLKVNEEGTDGFLANISVPFVPYNEKTNWSDGRRNALFEAVKGRLQSCFPKLDTLMERHHLWTPPEIETNFILEGGHLYGGELAIDQIFARPFPLCGRYATPIGGLFLGGDSTFSGGWMTGTPGYLAAKAIINSG